MVKQTKLKRLLPRTAWQLKRTLKKRKAGMRPLLNTSNGLFLDTTDQGVPEIHDPEPSRSSGSHTKIDRNESLRS